MSRLALTTLVVLAIAVPARADVKLPSVIDSHMVLQRDKPLPIWGWADPGEQVTVTFAGQKASATADKDGRWKVTLPAQKANAEGQTLTVKGNNTLTLTDVLVGEVWVGSGQSNMEWHINQSGGQKEALAAADRPTIRLFHVKRVQAKAPAKDVQPEQRWTVCSARAIPKFSAVLYNFGLKLQDELKVPVGLINSSWGGSAIEPWTAAEKSSGGMYNAMIAPLQPFAVRGVIWYQGESNVKQGFAYRDRMEALIQGWRRTWGQDLPFYFVQIAPWSGSPYPKDGLPLLWEAQVASLKIPNTGMVVVTDLVDNIRDIHPQNKKDVGHRLVLWALAKLYGRKGLVYSGPLYKGMKVEGDKVRLSFAHVGGGLAARDGKTLREFQIAGADDKFVPAEAVIDGTTVVVSARGVASPTQVRFGWSNTANPNLMNKEGLPASPFQTKNWRGGTGE